MSSPPDIFSPFGNAIYINLLHGKLFEGKERRPGDKGKYELTLALDGDDEDVQDFLSALEHKADEALEELRDEKGEPDLEKYEKKWLPVRPEIIDGEETGRVLVSANCNAGGLRVKDKKPWSRKVPVSGLNGQPYQVPSDLAEGHDYSAGTILRFSADVGCYQVAGTEMARARLELRSAQVKSANFGPSGGGQQSDFAGMEVVEDFE